MYPSLFGLEQMKHDSINGPPKEIFESEEVVKQRLEKQKQAKLRAKKSKKKQPKNESEDESESDEMAEQIQDEENPDAYNQSKLRRYEIQKMKYYYAVIHCNSKQTAIFLYDEYNGFEFENTNVRLNMSFIPDDIKFEQPVKEEASSIPANYEFTFSDG